MNNIKSTAKSRTTPRQIKLLPQHAFSWNITPNFDKLIITSIDQKAYFKDLDIEKLTLSIYAWDSAPKTAYKNYPLSEPLKFPLILDLKSQKFINIDGKPYFRIRLFDNSSKAIVCQSKSFLMTISSNTGSLLPMIPAALGNRIARVDIDEEDGPSIQLSNNFQTESGNVSLTSIKNMALNDPIFACSFWPFAIEQIISSAIRSDQDWAQKWLALAHELAPGHFHAQSGRITLIDELNFDSEVLPSIIDQWIRRFGYDKQLWESVMGDDD
ncbi:hypothetical protein [Synechococcus sp. M16.1]|uniref:hypothetical protein n=1 Tax=Synechococcus sp. M16.1 TaxID=1442553 RepID=UPI001646B187|nr:hypothetical protein [Synechococcus sp. M16.1]QNJ11003.1 hypothetical protein SynM161_50007 [Synechococcus sp. M16.1]